jgi:cobalt-zinc-cadmium efflux system protein
VHSHDHAGHSHGFGAHALEARREDSRRRMWIALAINAALLLAEVVGGLVTGSLAVLADASGLSATSAPRCWRRWSTA